MKTKRIQIDGWVIYEKDKFDWNDYRIYPYKIDYGGATTITACRVYVDIPADFDPTSALINQLDEKEKAADAAYKALKTQIESERNKLICSVMEPS